MSETIPDFKERFTRLHNLMLKTPTEVCDLENWRGRLVDFGNSLEISITEQEVTDEMVLSHKCGTVACAVGTACADPWFKSQGLVYSDYDYPVTLKDPANPEVGENYSQWNAVTEFFGVSPQIAEALFQQDGESDYPFWDEEYANKYRSETTLDKPVYNLDLRVFLHNTLALSDRRIVMMRIRNFLREQGWIDEQEYASMKAAEELPAPACVE